MYLELIRKIKDVMYVDELVAGGGTLQEVEKMKSDPIELFEKRGTRGLNFTNGTQMNHIDRPTTLALKQKFCKRTL